MKTEDISWCNDSGYSDVFNDSLCECTAPQVNDGMCICGKPINDNMTNTLKQNLELCKALAEVDRLTSENLDLKQQNHVWESEWQELYADNDLLEKMIEDTAYYCAGELDRLAAYYKKYKVKYYKNFETINK